MCSPASVILASIVTILVSFEAILKILRVTLLASIEKVNTS